MLNYLLCGIAFGILLGVIEGLLGKYFKVVVVGGLVVSALVILLRLRRDPEVYVGLDLGAVLVMFIGVAIGNTIGFKATNSAIKSLKGK